jgi:predicted transglutaminase-like cysteine proteinase
MSIIQRLFGKLEPSWMALLMALLSTMVLAGADLDRFLQNAGRKFGLQGIEAVKSWRNLLHESSGKVEFEQVLKVNDFFNRKIRFDEDINIWGTTDYWATPLEVLGRGEGDCEDYAIAKFATLRLLGIPLQKLQLTYVKARIGGPSSSTTQAHMVLSYYPTPDGDPMVLDNLISDIRPASRRPDLTPVFSFNSEGVWVGQAESRQTHSTERLSRWRKLLARMRDEGIE